MFRRHRMDEGGERRICRLSARGVGLTLLAGGIITGGALSARIASAPTSIQVTMDVIDPAADGLWESVGTIETARGAVQRAPRTDAEWQRAAVQARTLISGAALLKRPGLPVGGDGRSALADASIPGTRTARQIRADIDRNPARFLRAANRLEAGGRQALAAIDARDPDRLIGAGAKIDAACEACHAAYWYPRARLPLPPSAQFGRIASRP